MSSSLSLTIVSHNIVAHDYERNYRKSLHIYCMCFVLIRTLMQNIIVSQDNLHTDSYSLSKPI